MIIRIEMKVVPINTGEIKSSMTSVTMMKMKERINIEIFVLSES